MNDIISGPATITIDSPDDADTTVCTACVHPWSEHGAVGRRFCAATVSAALTRGCVCR